MAKETRDKHNKSAILLLMVLNHLSAISPRQRTKKQNDYIKQALERLKTLFTFTDLLYRKKTDQSTLLKIIADINTLQTAFDNKTLHRPIPSSKQQVVALPPDKKEDKTEEKTPAVQTPPLNEIVAKFLQKTHEQGKDEKNLAVKKNIQKTYFIKEIKNGVLRLHQLKTLLTEMLEHQNGLKKHDLFTTIRTERGKLHTETEGNTRSWQEMVSATKQELLKVKINTTRTTANDKDL